jgi:hypothetical protein
LEKQKKYQNFNYLTGTSAFLLVLTFSFIFAAIQNLLIFRVSSSKNDGLAFFFLSLSFL